MKTTLFILSLLIFNSCGKNSLCPNGSHEYFSLINSASKRIYVRTNQGHPDWTLLDFPAPSQTSNLGLKQNEKVKVYADNVRPNQGCWEGSLGMSKLTVYFFDAEIIEKTAWADVQKNGTGLLERQKIDLDYCIKNNWEVIYK